MGGFQSTQCVIRDNAESLCFLVDTQSKKKVGVSVTFLVFVDVLFSSAKYALYDWK